MSANLSPPNTALVAELSFSFQDELTATIQNALGVAVEVAVVEVTKLVGQVLRDVRDQMHETLRDNKSLKFRLQAAELELCAARGEERQVESIIGDKASTNSRIQQVHQQLNSLNVSQNTIKSGREGEHRVHESNHSLHTKNVEDRYGGFESEVADNPAYLTESFCEIREDGRICTQDIKPDLLGKSTLSQGDAAETKEVLPNIYSDNHEDVEHFNRACTETTAGHDTSTVDSHPFPEVTTKNAEVKYLVEVKVESADLGCSRNSGPHTEGGEEDYCPDSLSLAQTRLLEDWRPEALQLPHRDPDSFTPSTSHSLSDSPIFNPDIPDLDILSSSSATGLHAGFGKQQQYPPRETAGASTSHSHQMYSPQIGEVNNMAAAQHICKICGEKFHLSEELRRHRSLVHPKDMNKLPKRNLYPPGRSPYHCSLCGRDFNRMEHLKIHQRIHTGERPYACTVCNARFRHSWALTRHFRIHTGEKPYTCSQCGKTFRNCGGLRFHQRTHSMGGVG
ncbi:zinc finger and SCAN domain-containing protein 5C-like [Salvelinus namaycush]|uniref:Zinc finger and SCAN domain-containing protein 5C-like n=1 Tax=Salvelinus namaycush TaxID=8040 RepID=A0A8U0U905_SALNM|nr:zinc finger and SCAN domain-containing protein 5C-like [Salvelinus namaycush]